MIDTVQQATIIIARAAAVTPPKVPVDEPEVVEAVQMKLRALGYVGAGPPDGEHGDKTQAAILDFRNRNGLQLGTGINGDLLNALLVAPPKLLPEAQATATVEQIAPKVQAAKANLWTRFWAKVAAIPAAILAVLAGTVDHLGDAINILTPVRTFLNEWLSGIDRITLVAITSFLVAFVSSILWFSSRRGGDAITQGFRDGTVMNDKDNP